MRGFRLYEGGVDSLEIPLIFYLQVYFFFFKLIGELSSGGSLPRDKVGEKSGETDVVEEPTVIY